MFFIMNDDITYIKCDIKRSVFKLIKKACDIKEKMREYIYNIVYL